MMTGPGACFYILFAVPLTLGGCGQSDVAIGESGEEGSGAMVAQLHASCVAQVERNAAMATAATRICDCATERARDELSVADLMAGEASGLQDVVAQCADEAIGGGLPIASRRNADG